MGDIDSTPIPQGDLALQTIAMPKDTNANVCLLDHRDVVAAVADRNCQRLCILDDAHYICLLLWRDAATDHR